MATRAYLVAFLVCLGVMAAMAGPARGQAGAGQAGKEETVISATGTARVYRTPDYLDVMIGSETIDQKASGAQSKCKETMEKVVAAVNGLKLAGQELQTGTVDLTPRYKERPNYSSEEPQQIVGYAATITLRVRTTDINAASRIIDAGLGAGANRVEYVTFGIKEALAAREEAIKLATKAAKRKAQVMAEALDLRLGRVVNASASSHQSGWWGMGRYGQMAQMSQNSAGMDGLAGQNEDSEAVVPGKIEVWADASVTFAGVVKE
jgi:uncharacterized protein YggE